MASTIANNLETENTPLNNSNNKKDKIEENFLTNFMIQDIKLIDAYRKSLYLSVYKMLVNIGHDNNGSLVKNDIKYYNYSYNEKVDNLEDLGYGVKSYFLFHIYILINLLIMSIFAIIYMFIIFFKSYKNLRSECEQFLNYRNLDIDELYSYVNIYSICNNYFEEETFSFKNMNIFSILSGKIYLDYISYNIEINNLSDTNIYHKSKSETNNLAILINCLHFLPFFILLFVNIFFIKKSLDNYIYYKVRHRSQTDFACLIENIPYEMIKPNENEEKEFDNLSNEKEKEKKRKEIYLNKKEELKKFLNEKKDANINKIKEVIPLYCISNLYEKITDLIENLTIISDNKGKLYYKESLCCSLCDSCCCKKNKKILNLQSEIKDGVIKECEELNLKRKFNNIAFVIFEREYDRDIFYNKYYHSNFMKKICCNANNGPIESIITKKAPEPEDIIWKNLEIVLHFKIFLFLLSLLLSIIILAISFILQYFTTKGLDKIEKKGFWISLLCNIIVTIIIDQCNDYNNKIQHQFIEKYERYSTLSKFNFIINIRSIIFNFLNSALIPYFINGFIYGFKNYDALLSQIFTIFEWEGIGNPIYDWITSLFIKARKYNKTNLKIAKLIERQKNEKIVNFPKSLGRKELEKIYIREEFNLNELYCNLITNIWMSAFYFTIYPLGVPQTFINLIFVYFGEKINLTRIYQRPKYYDPKFYFMIINLFKITFLIYGVGNFIFLYDCEVRKNDKYYILILFFVLCLIPYENLFKKCFLKSAKEKHTKNNLIETLNYDEAKEYFRSDYESYCPITSKEGLKNNMQIFKKYLNEPEISKIDEYINHINIIDSFINNEFLAYPLRLYFIEGEDLKDDLDSKEDDNFLNNIEERTDEREIDKKNYIKKRIYTFLFKFNLIPYKDLENKESDEYYLNERILTNVDTFTVFELTPNKYTAMVNFVTNKQFLQKTYIIACASGLNIEFFKINLKKFWKKILNAHTNKIRHLEHFSSNFIDYIISTSSDNTIKVFDITNCKKILTLENIGNIKSHYFLHTIFSTHIFKKNNLYLF